MFHKGTLKTFYIIAVLFLVLNSGLFSQYEPMPQRVNIPSKMLRSVILPGWGELSLGNNSGFLFLGAETFFWSARLYYNQESKLKSNQFYNFALKHSGINPGRYSDDFYFHLSRYNHSGFGPGGYNQSVLQRARSLFPDDPEAVSQYVQENAYLTDDKSWVWESREHRRQYSIMHRDADIFLDYVKAFTGTLIANRVISVINTARIATIKNRRFKESKDFIDFNIFFDLEMRPYFYAKINF